MAVTVVKGRNTLGSLGTLASIAGMATGQPWITTLGTGMGAAGTLLNGNGSYQDNQAAIQSLGDILGGWLNPASGKIAQPGDHSEILDDIRKRLGTPQNPYDTAVRQGK